jgi:hypothetical protein
MKERSEGSEVKRRNGGKKRIEGRKERSEGSEEKE